MWPALIPKQQPHSLSLSLSPYSQPTSFSFFFSSSSSSLVFITPPPLSPPNSTTTTLLPSPPPSPPFPTTSLHHSSSTRPPTSRPPLWTTPLPPPDANTTPSRPHCPDILSTDCNTSPPPTQQPQQQLNHLHFDTAAAATTLPQPSSPTPLGSLGSTDVDVGSVSHLQHPDPELYFDRGIFYDFTSLVRELDVPGDIYEKKTYPFEFSTVEMPYESYNGVNVRLRYILKVTISRNYVNNIVEYRDFWEPDLSHPNPCLRRHLHLRTKVRNYTPLPAINNSIKMEVGIEDCLHIEFEYSKSKRVDASQTISKSV